jgi:hypothetical protein
VVAILITALAAFYATTLLRKLPGFRSLDEHGIKPVSCSLCMAFWSSLGWQLVRVSADVGYHWGWATWAEWMVETAAIAGLTFLLLQAHRWAQVHLGVPDLDHPQDFQPPAGGA